MNKQKRIFGVVLAIQEKEIKKYCFGKCGKIILGGMDGGENVGMLFPCKEQECPYMEKEMSEPIGDTPDGELVYLRKLIPV